MINPATPPGRHHLGVHDQDPGRNPGVAYPQRIPDPSVGPAEPVGVPHHDQDPQYGQPRPMNWPPPRDHAWAQDTPARPVPTLADAPPRPTRPARPPRPAPEPQPTRLEQLTAAATRIPIWTYPGEREALWSDVRRQVSHRARHVNQVHCYNAYDSYGSLKALSPHGIMLFFAVADRRESVGYRFPYLVRVFYAGRETEDLPRLLERLTATVESNIDRANANRRRWHPRGPEGRIANNGHQDLPDDAVYIGAGVTTLNTEKIGWHQAAQRMRGLELAGRSSFDLAGRCIVRLTDGTMMKVERDPLRPIGDTGVISNRTLDPARTFYFNPHQEQLLLGDPDLRLAWAQLEMLHLTLHVYLNSEPHR